MTTALQQNRYDQLVRRVGGIIGPGSKVNEVLTELFPMIDVENVPGELLILGGTRNAHGGTLLSASASNAGKYQLFNPADSGHIVTITSVLFSAGADAEIRWGRSAAVFAATVSGSEEFLDTRNPVADRPVAELRRLNEATLASAAGRIQILGDSPFQLSNENGVIVLSPGFGFEMGMTLLNEQSHCIYQWRERAAETSELNL